MGVAICNTTFLTCSGLPLLYFVAPCNIPAELYRSFTILIYSGPNCFALSNCPGGGRQSGTLSKVFMSFSNLSCKVLTSIFKYDIPFSNKSSYILLVGKSDSFLLSSKLA